MRVGNWAPDRALYGNGVKCRACELRRDQRRDARAMDQSVVCNFCGGVGRVGIAVEAIVAEAVRQARADYWPERERTWAKQSAAKIEGKGGAR